MKTPENQSFSGVFRVMIVNIDGQYFLGTLALNGLNKKLFYRNFQGICRSFHKLFAKKQKAIVIIQEDQGWLP